MKKLQKSFLVGVLVMSLFLSVPFVSSFVSAQTSTYGSFYSSATNFEDGQSGSMSFTFQNNSGIAMDKMSCIIPWGYYSNGEDLTDAAINGDLTKLPPIQFTQFSVDVGAGVQSWTLADYGAYLWGGIQGAIDLTFQEQSTGTPASLNSQIAPGQTVTVTAHFLFGQRDSGPAPQNGDYVSFLSSGAASWGCSLRNIANTDSVKAQGDNSNIYIVAPAPAPEPEPTPQQPVAQAPDAEESVNENQSAAIANKKFPVKFKEDNSKTSDLSLLTTEQAASFTGFKIEIAKFGSVEFTGAVNLNDASIVDNIENLDSFIQIQKGYVSVDVDKLTALKDIPAIIKMYDLSLDPNNIIILRDGELATDYVSNVQYDSSSKILTFTISKFSTYTVEEIQTLTTTAEISDNQPETSNNNQTLIVIGLVVSLIVISVGVIGGYIFYKKKKQKSVVNPIIDPFKEI